ncbi:hypothetical protein KBC86_02575 [Candidatus Gracilibacteria bacterium]|nr:hypothetical protein [Candidatus Gracilibacteria bacterium]
MFFLLLPFFVFIALIAIFFLPRKVLGWCIIGSIILAPIYNYLLLKNCPGDCSIRIDLLFLVPLFILMLIVWGAKKYLEKRQPGIKNTSL